MLATCLDPCALASLPLLLLSRTPHAPPTALTRHPAGILEAWAGMFNGLSREKADAQLKPFAPALLQFVEAIYADKAGQDDGELHGGAPAAGWLGLVGWGSQGWGTPGCWCSPAALRVYCLPAPPGPQLTTTCRHHPPHPAAGAGVWKASAALLGDVASSLSQVGGAVCVQRGVHELRGLACASHAAP